MKKFKTKQKIFVVAKEGIKEAIFIKYSTRFDNETCIYNSIIKKGEWDYINYCHETREKAIKWANKNAKIWTNNWKKNP